MPLQKVTMNADEFMEKLGYAGESLNVDDGTPIVYDSAAGTVTLHLDVRTEEAPDR